MTTGYGGTYRASVVDDVDPLQLQRLGVVVPDVYGELPVWATASMSSGSGAPLPAVGDLVWVSFEHGDTDYPIWQTEGSDPGAGPTGGYAGKYRGAVVSNDDPLQQNRLQVIAPDVDSSPAWAMPSDEVRYLDPPAVGAEVWIEYEYGDPMYPRWVGVA